MKMRICYFIQNHLGPAQASRLIRTLRRFQPECFVLVAHDPFAGHGSAAELQRALDVDVLEAREPARRGYLSLLYPYFDGLQWLADRGIDYDWIVYLSAQDYPTRPLQSLETLLATSGYDGFLRFWNAAAPVNPWRRRRQGLIRYHYQYYDAPAWTAPALRLVRWTNRVQSLAHIHLTYGPRVGLRRRPSPFDRGLSCYAGYQWSTLSRAAAEYVLERVRSDRELMEWFGRTICPCESVVQTLLVNSGRFNLCNDDLRYADFTGSRDGRPRTLTAEDVPVITGGTYHFARKFDPERDAQVLELLDARIIP
ncbi:MAG TPA: beta-1,6-N-acetylglucosaminyltransferase [Thermoanaerobaculia bacterium]|nr:beta-1,6-N-acetylglucosaminyltransferase [Thermoanaerobaculia bacterium]